MSLRDRFPEIAARYSRDPELDGVDGEPASSYLRASFLEGVRRFSPDARLDAFANIHLSGPSFDNGIFERNAADIFVRLQNEIDSITDESDRAGVQIGFRRIGKGSVVMHLDPVPPEMASDDQLPMSTPPQLESALVRVLDLHDAFESGDDALAITRATSELATRARQLVESLDVADARLEVDLSRSDGTRRKSSLTDVGRANARRFFERTPTIEDTVVSGYLRTASTTGHIELVSGRQILEIVDVPAEIAKSLQWDRIYRIRVRRTTSAAKAGSRPKVENQYISIAQHDEPIPFD
ncbi:hypothetical protein [Mycobacteroides abscessus]|uniref:Uncharacterized protein n=3 Tax=Mycobacteroides abscessus TaxID=36809 RepID=B1MFH2_MYCA9|nr:hypothetical protein [Mycobacteroides abscessus]EUA64039.1 hypothetical protein I542_4205 [Mycobacteroides abscessus 1948]ALM15099.1 hypothetical protein AOY11_01190 [Mycobacteroides abscessus]AMU44045.1 hypothetical protein A3O00_01260 [Mycobacteroides abscessus]AMU48947.1 hypothetical protein A3O01_01260 [Mycobacteroides abscessus]ANO07619.1 hypothetical protein BAB76_01265 [Mycobacteroides abscessus]